MTNEQTKKNKGGRPRFCPTSEQRATVELMSGVGIQHDLMSVALGISKPTLRRHFRKELDGGRVRTITRVADSLVRQALAGNVTAGIFYLKTQAGWKETQAVEHSGRVQTEQVTTDADAFTRSIAGMAARARAAGEDGETQH